MHSEAAFEEVSFIGARALEGGHVSGLAGFGLLPG